MADEIKAGTILIEEGTLLPESLKLDSEVYSNSWRSVKYLSEYELDQQIRETGWNFFFL